MPPASQNAIANEEKLKAPSEENPQEDVFSTQSSGRRAELLAKIEDIFHLLLVALIDRKPLSLKVPNFNNWRNVMVEENIVTPKNPMSRKMKIVCLESKTSENNFTILAKLLTEIYKMLSNFQACTKRELYYKDVELYGQQRVVNNAIDSICALLDAQEFELGILASSKGLIAGDLTIIYATERLECAAPRSVPHDISGIKDLQSNADYVLVVEKDTVFERLVQENIFERIDQKIILVTAKGYPDVNTRLLLRKISEILKKPQYIIVDADPHGIEIFFTYKYGSAQKAHHSKHLAVKDIEWIG